MFCNYRIILSIDGSGLKGLIPLKILDYLHQSITQIDREIDVTSWVDTFVSTSASSIFTGALMLKDSDGKTIHSPKDILNFYQKRGTQIFSSNVGRDAQNSTYPLSFILDYFFGKVNLTDLRNHFLFYSHNKTQNCLFPFSNTMERHQNLPLSKVMNACSAIPEKYPPLKLGNIELTDALYHIQNPSVQAYNFSRLLYPNEHLILISIGTGEDNSSHMVNRQVKDAHDELMKMKIIDSKLTYFRFQPKVKLEHNILNATQKSIDDLSDICDDYIFKQRLDFQKLINLMALKTA